MDWLPSRFRRFVGQAARWEGEFLPYLYVNIKARCYKGPAEAPHTCSVPGHSCCRKVVSYYRMYARRMNRRIHRGCQVNLEKLPSWELWSLATAPAELRRRYDLLTYSSSFRHRCVICGGRKSAVTVLVKDAGQAYEQTLPYFAVWSMCWVFIYVVLVVGTDATSTCREGPERSHVGGVPGKVVEANALWLVLWNHELLRMFAAVLSMSLLRV